MFQESQGKGEGPLKIDLGLISKLSVASKQTESIILYRGPFPKNHHPVLIMKFQSVPDNLPPMKKTHLHTLEKE